LLAALKRFPMPWFIGLFVLAAAVRGVWPEYYVTYERLGGLAKIGICLVLFLIGVGVDRKTLLGSGLRALALGVLLWLALGSAALAVVLWL